jgi:hypothetical protein
MAPYIEVPDSERTEMAERIDQTAILCGAIDPEVVYPSDAMSQVLTGRFTANAWTRFKTATDIYCARNTLPDPKYHLETRFASLGADSQGRRLPGCRISQECLAKFVDSYKTNPKYYETRILWNFDLYYPTCNFNPADITSIWDCADADCERIFAFNTEQFCAQRREHFGNPFNWDSYYGNYRRVRQDSGVELYDNEVKSHQNENTESWMTAPFHKWETSWTPHTQHVTFAKRCAWTCTNVPADEDFE